MCISLPAIRFPSLILAFVLAVYSGPDMALLLERGGGTMLYDTEFDITWLADANYASTSGFHPTGAVSLDVATSWVGNLEFGGYSDWRLPRTYLPDPTCSSGFNCVGSEMGHLFYQELGGVAANPISNLHGDQFYLFSNIMTVAYYWATPLKSGDPTRTWAFRFDLGYQGAEVIEGRTYWVWPVRSGDVASGDINGDGNLDAADVLLAIRIALDDIVPTAEQFIRGDIAPMVDGAPMPNGVIDAADVVAIISSALEM